MASHLTVHESSPDNAVLVVDELGISFGTADAPLHATTGVSFVAHRGQTLALVGESGCGKSITALALMGLLPQAARVTSGRVLLEGRDILRLPEHERRKLRGNRTAMIFQEPMTALNPMMSLGRQIAEPLIEHRGHSAAQARVRALELLDQVRIPDPAQRLRQFPHELSGGMRQRVMIAMALACDPTLLIADEPTTALDVTVQAQILALLKDLQRERDMGVILITHDLAVVAETAHTVVVMYAGQVVETGEVGRIFRDTCHPYTRGLIRSVPQFGKNRRGQGKRLADIPGTVPPLGAGGSGCVFADRCTFVHEHCRSATPALRLVADAHSVACFEAERVRAAA